MDGGAGPDGSVKKLYRLRREQGGVLLGLCAGIGQHLKIDPILVRLVLVLLLFTLAAGLAIPVIYVLFSLFIPYQPEQ